MSNLKERMTYTGDEGVEVRKSSGAVLVDLDAHFAALRASDVQGSLRGPRNTPPSHLLSVTEESE